MPKKKSGLIDQLRDAVRNAEVSRYRIAQDTGVAESALSRFVNGTAGLSMEGIDLVADYLGLEIIQRRKPSTKERSK